MNKRTKMGLFSDLGLWFLLILSMWIFNNPVLTKVVITLLAVGAILQRMLITFVVNLQQGGLSKILDSVAKIQKKPESGLNFSSFGKEFE